MNSNFLQMIGLGTIDVGYLFLALVVIDIIFLIMMIVIFAQISKYKKKYQKFMQGKDAGSLETDIMALYKDNCDIKAEISNDKKKIDDLYQKNKITFQKMGLVKYDAFKEMGGKLSFALALLDENNDGFIINSVHSGEGCYSYTKRIRNANSEIDLGKEEQVAINRALGKEANPDAE